MFWDGFQWVAKTIPKVRNIEHTTDVKKVQISGFPLEIGLEVDEIKQELNSRLNKMYHPTTDIIKTVDLILAQDAIAVELGSREDISKIKEAFDGVTILGQQLYVTSFEGKIINFNATEVSNEAASSSNPITNSAKTAAQAAAVANAAMNDVQGEDVKVTLKGQSVEQSIFIYSNLVTRILKIWNVVDPLYFDKRSTELDDIKLDMKEEFMTHGTVLDIRMVMPDKAQFGAKAGSIFVEYDDSKASEAAVKELKTRKYDSRVVRAAYVKPEMYEKYFKPSSESFIAFQGIPEIPLPYPVQLPVLNPAPIPANKEADYEFE